VWGAYGYPLSSQLSAADELDAQGDGEQPDKPKISMPMPSWASRPWTQPAHFVARGSGLASLREPAPRRDDRPFLLDLVHHG
jgi:hypothetical protein